MTLKELIEYEREFVAYNKNMRVNWLRYTEKLIPQMKRGD